MNPPPGYPHGAPIPGMPLMHHPMAYHGMPPPGFPGMMPPGYPPFGMGRPPFAPFPPMPGMPMPPVSLPPGPPAPMGPPPNLQSPANAGARVTTISAPPKMLGVETTIYVGRIANGVTDDFLERILQQCGKVTNWKRMMDPISNTPRSFGFARFENEEGALRALRLLNNFEIEASNLLLNVDDKTREALDRYEKNKASKLAESTKASEAVAVAGGEAAGDKPEEEANGNMKSGEEGDSDEAILARIKSIMSEKKAGDFLKGFESTTSSEDGEVPDSKKEEVSDWDKELERERRERERERAKEREKRRVEREREARKREREEREYREMEKEWEAREREKERLRERREREEKKERERQIDRELNYDEEDDRKRRKMGRRAKEREREELDDANDRRKEVEEEEQARMEEERKRMEELRRKEEAALGAQRGHKRSYNDDTEPNGHTPISPDSSEQRIRMGLRISAPSIKTTKLGVTPGFSVDEEQNSLTNPKRKKLVPLQPIKSEEQLKKEREEEAKQIVAIIPAGKEDLFNFQLDWSVIDEAGIVPKKMKPWVTKKIVEYLGEEEGTLIEFVLAKMSSHMAPQEILDQLAFVLEDEAELFVIKLWRMLIFEMIRAQKAKERGESTPAQ